MLNILDMKSFSKLLKGHHRGYLLLFSFFLFCISCNSSSSSKVFTEKEVAQHFVPQVNSLTMLPSSSFYLKELESVGYAKELKPLAQLLVKRLNLLNSDKMKLEDLGGGDIQLLVDPKLEKEAYTLRIEDEKVHITGGSISGVYYGIQTFLQLLPSDVYGRQKLKEEDRVPIVLPAIEVSDAPHFAYRGMMLDVSRHFIPFELLLKYVDILSQHKMNVLHLHLADSQGWRIEIKSHPELVNIGSVRGLSEKIPPFRHSRTLSWQPVDADPYGPFYYTQEEIKVLVKYAQIRGVEIIPEIDVPGHSTALNRSLKTGCGTHPDRGDVVCVSNEENYKILEDIFSEIAALFPSKYIHFGGDEVRFKQWKRCWRCQRYMKEHGMKDEKELQNHFVHRITGMLHKMHKNPIGWNEILLGGELPKGTMVMSWEGVKPGIEAAQRGIDVVMAPGPYCYFDMKELKSNHEPGHDWAGVVKLEDTYSYNPLWDIPVTYQKHIKGVTGALWSEFVIPEESQLWYKSYPRICALAEVGWTNEKNKDYRSFMHRLGLHHFSRLEEQEVNYRIPKAKAYHYGTDSVYFKLPFDQACVRYSLEESGNVLYKGGELYGQPFLCKNTDRLKYLTISPSGRLSAYASSGVSDRPLAEVHYGEIKTEIKLLNLEEGQHYKLKLLWDKGPKEKISVVGDDHLLVGNLNYTLYKGKKTLIDFKCVKSGSANVVLKYDRPTRGRGRIWFLR